jgi:FAD/FMN-containing dehydrogenase
MPSAPDLPTRKPASARCIAELAQALGADRVWLDEPRRRAASLDYSWISPVLSKALPCVVADVVASPRTTDELERVLGIAYEHETAVTSRGKGTGNYGQAVPLAAGIVLDTTSLDAVLDIGCDYIHAQAGISFVRLDAAAHAVGKELAMFPSTMTSALGGFLCGGAGGTGSIEHGFVWDGVVSGLEVVPCWSAPERHWFEGTDTLPFLHAYGTTGVVASAAVRVEPLRSWAAMYLSFGDFDAASSFGVATLELDPCPRNVCVDDPEIVACFPHDAALPRGRWSCRVLAEASTTSLIRALAVKHGGKIEDVRPNAMNELVSLSYNHVTLRAKRAHSDWFHLQVGGPTLITEHEAVRDAVFDSVLHLDANQRRGTRLFGGLLLAPFQGIDALYEAIDRVRALGVDVVDPHTWRLGGHGDLGPLQRASATYDPLGLLNPGKLPAP